MTGIADTDTLRLTTRSRRISLGRLELLGVVVPGVGGNTRRGLVRGHLLAGALGYGEGLGLFRREQTPAWDRSLDELGEEELLSDAVTGFNVRFFDGEAWADAWDTTEEGSGVLPRVIEVTLDLFGGWRGERGFGDRSVPDPGSAPCRGDGNRMKMPPASLRTTRDARPGRFHTGPVLGEAGGSARVVMALISPGPPRDARDGRRDHGAAESARGARQRGRGAVHLSGAGGDPPRGGGPPAG